MRLPTDVRSDHSLIYLIPLFDAEIGLLKELYTVWWALAYQAKTVIRLQQTGLMSGLGMFYKKITNFSLLIFLTRVILKGSIPFHIPVIFAFSKAHNKQTIFKKPLMAGLEPGSTGDGSDHSANCATKVILRETISFVFIKYYPVSITIVQTRTRDLRRLDSN